MISEDQQDQAALSALGLLDDDEQAEFARALAADPELRALVDELRESAAALTLAAESATLHPSGELKARLLAGVEREKMTVRPEEKAARNPWLTWVPWAIAAGAVALSVLTSLERDRWQREAIRVRGELVREAAARKQLPPLAQVTVCRLELTPEAPAQPGGTVVWDPSRRQGELLITRLKPPAEGHDYQLWAVEAGRQDAVSAGVVHVDAGGNARVEFKPAEAGGNEVQAFAVSLEKAGGSETNQGPILLSGKF